MSAGQGDFHRRLSERPQETTRMSEQERGTRRTTGFQQQNQESAAQARWRAQRSPGPYCQSQILACMWRLVISSQSQSQIIY